MLVLEDVHWADDATLDTITVLGRRIAGLPALVVLTFRVGEAAPGHRLHATLGAIRAEDTAVVELQPYVGGVIGERSPADGAHARCASVCRLGLSSGIGVGGIR